MAANVYECMLLLDTTKVSGDVSAVEAQLLAIMQKHNAEALEHRPWDERRLSYAIKKQKKGLYYLMYIRTEGKNLVGIEHDIGMNETVLRSMILKIDPKLVDTMLALAKGEHAPALHAIQDDPLEDIGLGGDDSDRPRRGRRPEHAEN